VAVATGVVVNNAALRMKDLQRQGQLKGVRVTAIHRKHRAQERMPERKLLKTTVIKQYHPGLRLHQARDERISKTVAETLLK